MESAGSGTSRPLPLRSPCLVLTVGLVLAAAAGCSSGSSKDASNGWKSGGTASAAASGAAGTGAGSDLQTDYQNTVKAVLPSVVQITAGESLGSGIVYDHRGDIVTNAHVIGTGRSFKVTLADSSATLDATLVYSYPASDLAVIKLTNPPSDIRPAAFVDSSKVDVGQIVLAMGNPLGLESSVTQGIVSAVGRTVSEPATAESQGATIPNMVQTSAAINPGNSGGALVNLADQVVGINTLAATSGESGAQAPGIGFAIPASAVVSLADQMIKNGKVTNSGRAALGITSRTVLTSGGDTETGAGVVSVTSGGPADKAGIKAGDVITKIGGTAVASSNELSEVLAGLQPGLQVQVTFVRDGATRTASVTLGTLAAP
ncbi:S1C family serine protease [Streptacidiphilus carbonis]|uniref:S1C family serine protease n=1 Tax=Streptacidiphilus carbonis TaxID=105422 RepID=UPI0009FE14CF|nr:trypsin-like peptidase domain-containing protein [Streptacidiphilus carbonis]